MGIRQPNGQLTQKCSARRIWALTRTRVALTPPTTRDPGDGAPLSGERALEHTNTVFALGRTTSAPRATRPDEQRLERDRRHEVRGDGDEHGQRERNSLPAPRVTRGLLASFTYGSAPTVNATSDA